MSSRNYFFNTDKNMLTHCVNMFLLRLLINILITHYKEGKVFSSLFNLVVYPYQLFN